MQEIFLYNFIYVLFSFFLVYPPQEAQSLGLSIPSLFASLLGSEELYFIHYHIVRICVTVFVHSLLPLGYFLYIGFCLPDLDLFNLNELSIYWKIYFSFSILFALGVNTLVYYWYFNSYENHPISCKLKKCTQINTWKQVANEINTEFRRYDKFTSGSSLYNRLYLTDNWLIKVNLYSLNISPKQKIELVLTKSIDLNLAFDGAPSHQFLNLLIKPSNNENLFKPFSIRLNSLEYKDFTDKLSRPIAQACDIIIKTSLPEQFLDAFREQVFKNTKTQEYRQNVDFCIGCMKKEANVKLMKMCDEINNGECRRCSCRAMWCLECMGKWFAYRQDQSEPHTWLGSKASCPTCRATFCMLDVAPIEFLD